MEKITITAGDITIQAKLNESETARRILDILPVEGTANVWGDEIYFSIPLKLPQASDARVEMDVGGLAYWPQGNAFCIIFGPTPVSVRDEPRAYSPVNVFGSIIGDATVLKAVDNGSPVMVIRVTS